MPAKKIPTIKRKPSTVSETVALLVPEKLAKLVHYLRREKVILDSDLAELYGVDTGALNRAVKRNIERFPDDFMFQLTDKEEAALRCQTGILKAEPDPLRSQSATLKRGQHRKYLPYAFTEQGVAMLSSVLRSPRAVEVNIAIMRTFVQLRRLMDSNALLAEKIEALEEKYADHDQQFQLVFEAIKQLIATPVPPAKELGFHTLPSASSSSNQKSKISNRHSSIVT